METLPTPPQVDNLVTTPIQPYIDVNGFEALKAGNVAEFHIPVCAMHYLQGIAILPSN